MLLSPKIKPSRYKLYKEIIISNTDPGTKINTTEGDDQYAKYKQAQRTSNTKDIVMNIYTEMIQKSYYELCTKFTYNIPIYDINRDLQILVSYIEKQSCTKNLKPRAACQ